LITITVYNLIHTFLIGVARHTLAYFQSSDLGLLVNNLLVLKSLVTVTVTCRSAEVGRLNQPSWLLGAL